MFLCVVVTTVYIYNGNIAGSLLVVFIVVIRELIWLRIERVAYELYIVAGLCSIDGVWHSLSLQHVSTMIAQFIDLLFHIFTPNSARTLHHFELVLSCQIKQLVSECTIRMFAFCYI